MIRSKFKTWGIFAILTTPFLFTGILFFDYALVSVVFFGGHVMKRGTLPPAGALLFILVFAAIALLIVQGWRKFFFSIKIDPSARAISFQNIFTWKKSVYRFDELDGYMDIYAVTGRGDFKVLYLVKDKRAVKIINGYYYANVDEMQEALSSMRYLGKQENWRSVMRRGWLGRPVVD